MGGTESSSPSSASLQPFDVPTFDANAHGQPSDWNNKTQIRYWSRRMYTNFKTRGIGETKPDINKVLKFLSLRRGRNGQPVSELLDSPVWKRKGWYRCSWIGFDEARLPVKSLGQYNHGEADWQLAWHGCKFEALCSIMYHGRLNASCDREKGERFFPDKPGVYVHKDVTAHKAENYTRFVELFQDGVFWCAKWEVRVDRSDRIVVEHTDQWVQEERSVRLAALWLCGYNYLDMDYGWEVSSGWNPLLEANPHKGRSQAAQNKTKKHKKTTKNQQKQIM